MAHINKTWFAAAFLGLMFVGVQACTDSNFAGGGAGKSAGLTGKDGKDGKDSGNDGRDGTDSRDSGSDSGDGPDGGNDEADSGPDSGNADEADTSDTDGPDGDDSEVSSKTRHDATITRQEHDNAFELKIETIIKGKSTSTQTLKFSDNGKNDPTVAKLVCRNKKDTCLKLTSTNLEDDQKGHIEVVGGTPNATVTCAWATETGNSAVVSIDADGDEHSGIFDQGTCKAEDQDEQITIMCPESKKLQVQLCTGG